MPRIFDRLSDQNSQGPAFRYAWQKFCEQVESNIGSLTSQLALITTAQNTANTAQTAANAAQTSANTANADLANIASDNLLTPGEKPVVIKDRDAIIAEQSGLDTTATAYGITTEKTTYDTAVSALTTYLATLTSAVLWSDLSGNTTIVGTTFRTKFLDVYNARQALMNQIVTVAKNTASASMPDIPAQSVPCDYAGTPNTGALPKVVAVKRYNGTTDVTTSATWSASTDSGTITYTIGAATGLLNITAMTSNSAVLTVTSVHNSVTLTRKASISKALAPAPTGGSGGGTSASVSSFSSINSATHAAITTTLTVTTGSVGTVTLSAPLYVDTDAVSPAGSYPVYGKWQWDSTGGGVWTDVATEVITSPNCSVQSEGGGVFSEGSGTLTVSTSKTGLAASSSQKFRLMARNSTGTRTMYFSGTASAVGS